MAYTHNPLLKEQLEYYKNINDLMYKITIRYTDVTEKDVVSYKGRQFQINYITNAKFDFHGHYTGGFVPGKHYAERTRQEYQSKYPEMMSEKISEMLKDHNL